MRWPVGGKDKLVGEVWSRERAAFVYCGEHPQDGAWCRARPLGSFSQAMLFCSSRPIASKHILHVPFHGHAQSRWSLSATGPNVERARMGPPVDLLSSLSHAPNMLDAHISNPSTLQLRWLDGLIAFSAISFDATGGQATASSLCCACPLASAACRRLSIYESLPVWSSG